MSLEDYELVFKGPRNSLKKTHKKLLLALSAAYGEKVVERAMELQLSGPLTLKRSSKREDLEHLLNVLRDAGGDGFIARAKPQQSVGTATKSSTSSKLKSLDELRDLVAKLRKKSKKIVQCQGVFDLLHIGHFRHLNSAKRHGDVLIVTIVSDRYAKKEFGKLTFAEDLRAEAIANIECCDYVCIVDSASALESIAAIRPDFYAKEVKPALEEDGESKETQKEKRAVEKAGGKVIYTEERIPNSAHLRSLFFEQYPNQTVTYLRRFASKNSAGMLAESLEKLRNLKILVIGDTIIDQYHYCTALGKSAKESIIVNKYISEENFAGGSLATANHVAQVSKNIDLLTVLGKENSYEDFIRSHLNPNIKPHFIHRPSCVTTVKRRFVSTDANVKLFELCHIDDGFLSDREEEKILHYLEKNIRRYDLVIVSDFGHGMMTKNIMKLVCAKSRCLALNVQTNGANQGFNLVTKYSKADLVCIDERELRLATRDRFSEVPALMKEITKSLKCKQIVATRGHHGSICYNPELGFHKTPAFASSSVDKVGAGDAFFAYVAPCFAVGMPQDILGFVGNAVGALKVQIVGNRESVKYADFVSFTTRLLNV